MNAGVGGQIEFICSRQGISLVYLFGSQVQAGLRVVRGEAVRTVDPLTDLDVGVVTSRPLPEPSRRPSYYAGVYNDLEGLFRPLTLDLVLLEENHSVFQLEAIKGECIYQESQEKRDDYEMMVLRRAADFRPVLEKFLREVLEEV